MIFIKNELCSGCRACEIACSYHHTKKFGRKSSSIIIKRHIDTGKKEILIIDTLNDTHPKCDECKNENLPLCVKYCSSGALLVMGGIIRE